MPFIAPTPQTAKLWGRLNRIPLLLDICSVFLAQLILVACIANALQAVYHRPHYHGDSDSLYLPPPSLGNVSGYPELDQDITLEYVTSHLATSIQQSEHNIHELRELTDAL